ncbi:MAG: glycosyltransferase family 4 protein [Candidatus Omnitrophota bacterium]
MKILYICPRFPYPADRGDTVVVHNQLKYLSRRNSITLLTMVTGSEGRQGEAPLSDYCERIETFRKGPNFSLKNFWRALLTRDPFTVIRYRSQRMFERSKWLIESGGFDIVYVAFYYMGQYALDPQITVPRGTAVILDTHNIEYLIYRRAREIERHPLRRLLIALEASRIRRYELSRYRLFDRCLVFSDLDRAGIESLAQGAVLTVSPACMEIRGDAGAAPAAGAGALSILFFGLLSTFANEDAVLFFYQEVFPLIREKIPGVTLSIVGDDAPRSIRKLAVDPLVKLLGHLPDMSDALRDAAVVVAPLRLGGGTRVKILESWAAGKAVVATSVGVQGIDATPGSDILIADTAAEFSRAVIALLENPDRRRDIGAAALKKVRDLYDPEKMTLRLERILRETRENKAGTAA